MTLPAVSPSNWKCPSPSEKTVRCELPAIRTSAWPMDSPVTEFMTEPLSVKLASLVAECDADICAIAVPLKTAHQIKLKAKLKLKLKTSHSRDRRLPSSAGRQRLRLAQQQVVDCCLQDTIDCRWLNCISGDAVIINPRGRHHDSALKRNHSCVAQVVESPAKQPRSGDSDLSPARKRRVKWETVPSRVAAIPLFLSTAENFSLTSCGL